MHPARLHSCNCSPATERRVQQAFSYIDRDNALRREFGTRVEPIDIEVVLADIRRNQVTVKGQMVKEHEGHSCRQQLISRIDRHSRRDMYRAHIGTKMPVAPLWTDIPSDAHSKVLVPQPGLVQAYVAP